MWSDDLDDVEPDSVESARTATEVVDLGYKCDLPGVLKRALYELLRMPGFGQRRADCDEDMEGTEIQKGSTSLPNVHFHRLLFARENLNSQWFSAITTSPEAFPCPQSPNGIQPISGTSTSEGVAAASSQVPMENSNSQIPRGVSRCTSSDVAIWSEMVHDSSISREYLNDPICGLAKLGKLDWRSKGYCDGCIEARKNAWSKQRKKIWKNLDIWLEL
jgi:hypothetical protein